MLYPLFNFGLDPNQGARQFVAAELFLFCISITYGIKKIQKISGFYPA
jgi:hypothetical protein